MAALPKKKSSKKRTRQRREHSGKLYLPVLSQCPKCGKEKLSHRVCSHCGFYKEIKTL